MTDHDAGQPEQRQISRPRRATIADVARGAGVSATTVSHALSGRRPVEAETRRRIAETAERLGYVPDARARGLRTGRADAIAILSSMPAGVSGGASGLGFLIEIAAAAAAAALDRGLALMLVPPIERRPAGVDAPLVDRLQVDGAILVEPAAGEPEMARLQRRGIPVVTIGRHPGDTAAEAASVDLRSGDTMRLLLDHLEAQGANRIALLVGMARRTSHIEGEAVHRALSASRDVVPVVVRLHEEGGVAAGRAATLELMRLHPDIDAICAPVDAFAVGALLALAELGLPVPERVRVATRYDGLLARTAVPGLTAVDLRLDVVASAAIALLLDCIEGGSPGSSSAPDARLVMRGSSRTEPAVVTSSERVTQP